MNSLDELFYHLFLCMTCFFISIRIVMLLNLKILKLALGSWVGNKYFEQAETTNRFYFLTFMNRQNVVFFFFAPKIGPQKKIMSHKVPDGPRQVVDCASKSNVPFGHAFVKSRSRFSKIFSKHVFLRARDGLRLSH